jgi:hypothetical protein
MSKLQKKPAAHKRGHPTLQNMNFFYFCGAFLPSWIRIRIPNSDPDSEFGSGFRIRFRIHWPDWIRIQSGSGSETLLLLILSASSPSRWLAASSTYGEKKIGTVTQWSGPLHFGKDPDPRIRTYDLRIRIRIRILVFSSVTFKRPKKKKFFIESFLVLLSEIFFPVLACATTPPGLRGRSVSS